MLNEYTHFETGNNDEFRGTHINPCTSEYPANWSLLQKLSYETNKRLKKQALKARKIQENEILQIERILNRRRICQREQIAFLRENFHKKPAVDSELLLSEKHFDEYRNSPDASTHGVPPKCNLLERTLVLVHNTPNFTRKNLFETGKHYQAISTDDHIYPLSSRSHIQIDDDGQSAHLEGGKPERRSQSAEILQHNIFSPDLKPITSHQIWDSPMSIPCMVATVGGSPVFENSEQSTQSFIESPQSVPSVTLELTSFQVTSPITQKSQSLQWLRTGSPPVDRQAKLCSNSEHKRAADELFVPIRVSKQPSSACLFATATIPVDLAAPVYTITASNCMHNQSGCTTAVSNMNFRTLPTSSIGVICFQPSVTNHSKNSIRVKEVVSCVDQIHNDVAPRLNSSKSAILTIAEPVGGIHTDGAAAASRLGTTGDIVVSTERLSKCISENASGIVQKTQTVELCLIADSNDGPDSADLHTNEVDENMSQSPKRSILKSGSLKNSPEDAEVTFPRIESPQSREASDTTPSRMRMNESPNMSQFCSNFFERYPCLTPDSGCSESPRSQRKSVRFADELQGVPDLHSRISSGIKMIDFTQLTNTPSVKCLRPTSPNSPISGKPASSVICSKSEIDMTPIRNSRCFDGLVGGARRPSMPVPTQAVTSQHQDAEARTPSDGSSSHPTCVVQQSPNVHSKPPLQPAVKSVSNPSRLNRIAKLGYAEILKGRPKPRQEPDQFVFANQRSTWAPSINRQILSPPLRTHEGSSDQVSPLASPSTNTVQPAQSYVSLASNQSKLSSTDLKGHVRLPPKVLTTAKLDQFTRALSEPRGTTRWRTPSDSETEQLANLTRLTELNYETQLIAPTNPTVLVVQTDSPRLSPDYEGLDRELSEKLKTRQQIPAVSHAIYLKGTTDQHSIPSSETSTPTQHLSPELAVQTGNKGDQSVYHAVNEQNHPFAGLPKATSMDNVPKVSSTSKYFTSGRMLNNTRSTQIIDQAGGDHEAYGYHDLPHIVHNPAMSSARLLQRRPQLTDSNTQQNSGPHSAGTRIQRSYINTATPHTYPAARSKAIRNAPPHLKNPSNMTNAALFDYSRNTLPSILSNTRVHTYGSSLHTPLRSVKTATSDEPPCHLPTQAEPTPVRMAVYASSEDGLSEFLKSERACEQTGRELFGISRPTRSDHTPVRHDYSKLRTQKPGENMSPMSIEEARLLKSLDRLNNRLCDILSDRR
ncbi:hypothetical protein PHET_01004 [Paragonimus heterotremus]|uniref:Uncharacterized protein n=1 Tax=Paragonimus heterotremus TaxID=100268 RepID=A0A8J4WJK2_9TREM|nr:hypothetical protein PHET_01004 [Paragonimus heterotremus]